MTKYEIIVIAAAAAAFVVINIIMWSIIAAKEKSAQKKKLRQQKNQEISAPSVQEKTALPAEEIKKAPSQPVRERHRVKDFIIIDDIVITHTDERI